MKLKTKKILTNITTYIFFLMGGIEYAVILPTLNMYLKTMDAEPIFLGMSLSAFSLSALFAGPIFGKWHDKTGKVKVIILFGNVWEIAGNFMYFVGINKYFIVLSRLVAGVGSGVGAAIFAQITHTTTKKERTAAISIAMASRQIGLLLGPGLNLFLEHLNGYIGPWEVNNLTSPGIFMCAMWILMEIMVIFMYYDIPPLEEQEKILAEEAKEANQGNSVTGESDPLLVNAADSNDSKVNKMHSYASTEAISTAGVDNYSTNINTKDIEQFSREGGNYGAHSGSGTYGSVENHVTSPETGENQDDNISYDGHVAIESRELREAKQYAMDEGSELYPGKWSLRKEFIREEVVVILAAQFFFLFNQTSLETLLTPYTLQYLNFNEIQNSLLYCGAGLEVIFAFVLIKFLSKKVEDRTLLAFGFIIELVSITGALVYMPMVKQGSTIDLLLFLIIFVVQVFGLAFLAAPVISMFSKHTTERTQGFSQGIRRGIASIGTILGPLWAGGALTMLHVNIGVIVGLVALICLMLALSWKQLKDPVKYWWIRDVESESHVDL
ncbi:uncharacterized protein [Ptychodera flava]|uniref:uncharacterized protein n=1 Tax=Ptychodera flava TaxID=63121 RepID=UPI003969BE94